MKKIVSLVLALVLLSACAFSEGMPAINLPGAFAHESNEFSIATAFMVLASFMPQTAQDAESMFASRNFTVLKQENYDKPVTDHSHTSAYTLAAGEMEIRGEMRNVAVVTVRGTSDGEWHSNMDFAFESGGDCQYAENFMAASQAIYDGIKDELAAMENPVIIATGYSRGAACANLLGKLIDDDFGKEDVYVYTYATPNTVRGEFEGYDNIFNLVNVNDLITSMPPAQWGFSRLGVDMELRDEEFINTPMHAMFLELLGLCPDIDSYYNVRHSLTGNGLADDGATAFEVFSVMAGVLTGEAEANMKLAEIMETPNDFTNVLGLYLSAGGQTDGANQHMPEVYVKLMQKMISFR